MLMDDICLALFNVLNEEAKGGCGVFYEDELLEAIPGDLRTRETLEAALKKLHGEGCIEVKYARGEAFCIAVKREFIPKKDGDDTILTPTAAYAQIEKRTYAQIFILAFSGALIGGIIAAVMGAILC